MALFLSHRLPRRSNCDVGPRIAVRVAHRYRLAEISNRSRVVRFHSAEQCAGRTREQISATRILEGAYQFRRTAGREVCAAVAICIAHRKE